jgi:hypothetical protein
MLIKMNCPRCGKRYELDETLAGRRVRCKQCAQVMRVLTEPPATPKETVRLAPRDDVVDRPPPSRPAPRPTRARRKPQGRLPPLVKALLAIVGVLIVGASVGVAGIVVASGRPELAVLPLAILGGFVCMGLCVVSALKIVFFATETDPVAGLACLLIPPYLLIFVLRHWEDTKRLFFLYLAGVAGFILWGVYVPPYLKSVGKPRSMDPRVVRTGPNLPGSEQSVKLIVTGVPSPEASGVIGEKIRALVDQGNMATIQGQFSADQSARYELWPVRDPQALADRITFGTVTRIAGREIRVAASPVTFEEITAYKARHSRRDIAKDSEIAGAKADQPLEPQPPADADPVTRAIIGLRSSDNGKRKQAIQQLAKLTPTDDRRDEVQVALRPLLDHEDGFLVEDVITAMAAWRTLETVPALILKTTDSRFNVRWHAIETLGRLKDPRAAEAIANRLKEDGLKSEPALREMGPAAEPVVLALLRNPDPEIRRKACNILQEIGGKETLTFMTSARPDPDFGVRVAAQAAITAIGSRVGPLQKQSSRGR